VFYFVKINLVIYDQCPKNDCAAIPLVCY